MSSSRQEWEPIPSPPESHRHVHCARCGEPVIVCRHCDRAQRYCGPECRSAARRIEHMWFERFDKEREGFIEQRELDTSRPRADQEISWQYVTFDEAVALAAKADKPLFVDVMAFWCVWCYRLDYYTYVDREVATVLSSSYIPVKIIQEQDFAGDYDMLREKMEARGIPAMGIFDPSGDLLHKISGWKKPEDFLADLEQGLAAFRGGEH